MNNNFENNMNETQFEDMRQQLNTLKKKLGEQEIVNDRLIRRSMKQEDLTTLQYHHSALHTDDSLYLCGI